MSLFQYLNDRLGDAQSKSEALKQSNLFVRLSSHPDYLINEKSKLILTQKLDFVGMVFMTQKNPEKILSMVQTLSQVNQAKSGSPLIGIFQAQTSLIPLRGLKVRLSQLHLQNHWNQVRDPPSQLVPMT